MAYMTDGYYGDVPAASAIPSERVRFIQRTYLHLAGAIAACAGIEAVLIGSGLGESVAAAIFSGRLGMFLFLALFIASGYVARWWANNSPSKVMQYAGLGLYVGVQSLILLPLLIVARQMTGDNSLIGEAGFLTGGLVMGLTTAVLLTKADFSFMGTALVVLSWVALATIVAALLFNFGLGIWFSALMIAMASAFVIYDTSNVLHHYPTTHYVGASLELFASVALLFFYILRFAMQMQSRR